MKIQYVFFNVEYCFSLQVFLETCDEIKLLAQSQDMDTTSGLANEFGLLKAFGPNASALPKFKGQLFIS